MSENSRGEISADVRQQAQDWVVRLHSGAVTAADLDALAHWRGRSALHRRAFADANLTWNTLRAAARGAAAHLEAGAAERRLDRRMLLGGALAASAAGAAVMAVRPPLDLWPSIRELSADHRTGAGEQQTVALSDQVSVELNTRTSVLLTRADTERTVELIAGEVAVAAAEPVVVVAGGSRAHAERGFFTLHRQEDSVLATCLDGALRVACQVGDVMLGRGQQVVYDGHRLGAVVAVDVEAQAAWRRGLLVFENRPLAQVVDELNRYRRGRIVLLNAELGRRPLDATFRLDRIEEAVPKIAHVFGAKVRVLPAGIVVLS